MKNRSDLRPHFLLATMLLCFASIGCEKMINSATSDPEIRQKAVDSARTSCISTMHKTVKVPITPALDAEVTDYCTCFSTRGMEKFTNAELIELGLSGGKMTPQQTEKINDGVKICQAQAFGK